MMHQWILNHLSIGQLLVCATLLCIAVSLGVYTIAHRYFPAVLAEYFLDNSYFSRILITGSSVLFAFTIIILWQTLNTAKHTVEVEAGALSKIIMNSDTFPAKEKEQIKEAVVSYVHLVVNEEWPLMREGRSSAAATEALEKIHMAIENYKPVSVLDQIFYKEVLENFNTAYEARYLRLEELDSVIPPSLYSIMVITMFLLLFTGALLYTKKEHSQVTHLIIISAIIGVNLALITAFDYPFSGEISARSKPFTSEPLKAFL